MRQTIRLGRVAGIPIGVNWSVVVIAALIGWTLAGSAFPYVVPGESTSAYWLAGAVAAVLFFASLLVHELAHALVGRRYEVPVESITLWLLGGVSRFGSEPPNADAELRISLAGPLTSFGLAIGFGASEIGSAALHLPDLVSASLSWLCLINLMLGFFNLLPAYPLDGGRVLRAWAWRRSGDRLGATRTAARVGHVLAWVLIGLGMLLALGGVVISGLWLVLIGWFLDNAGRAEADAVVQTSMLGGLTVGRLMSADPVTVSPLLTTDQLVQEYVLGRHHSAFPVVGESGEPLGLVGLDQVRRVPPERRAVVTVGEIAEPLDRIAVVAPNESGADALRRMAVTAGRRALVLDDQGRLVGILSHSDLARAMELGGPAPARPMPPPIPPPVRS